MTCCVFLLTSDSEEVLLALEVTPVLLLCRFLWWPSSAIECACDPSDDFVTPQSFQMCTRVDTIDHMFIVVRLHSYCHFSCAVLLFETAHQRCCVQLNEWANPGCTASYEVVDICQVFLKLFLLIWPVHRLYLVMFVALDNASWGMVQTRILLCSLVNSTLIVSFISCMFS